jgi:glycine/D-amino acid oxidase-like deaminating enzyme
MSSTAGQGGAAAPATMDVAVVGGGIVGCSIAYWLARRGLKVHVYERARVASEQSSRAWGFIRQQGRHAAEIPLAAEANGLWTELTAQYGEASTGFTRGGILMPAQTQADEERVRGAWQTARDCGIATELLDAGQVRRLIPEFGVDWRCGLYTASDAHGDPPLATATIARAAREAGAVIHEDTPVLAVMTRNGRACGLRTFDGDVHAGAVVLANAIGAPVLAAPLGLELPIQLIKSSVGLTRPAQPFTRVAMWGPRVAFRPHADGRFTIGNGYRGVGADYELTIDSLRSLRHFLPAFRQNWRQLRLRVGPDFLHQLRARSSPRQAVLPLPEPRPNARKVRHNLAAFNALFPQMGAVALERAWAGRLDLTPDVIPILDQPAAVGDLYVAAGFSGHGFALGPVIGRQMAQWIADGRPSLDLHPFRLARFSEPMQHRRQAAL